MTITAQAKASELPSYTGAIFGSIINGKTTTNTGICATNQPSTSPPTMPKPPNSGSLEIKCPAKFGLLLVSGSNASPSADFSADS